MVTRAPSPGSSSRRLTQRSFFDDKTFTFFFSPLFNNFPPKNRASRTSLPDTEPEVTRRGAFHSGRCHRPSQGISMPNQHGPVTREGKLASSMNHLTHGSTATSLFIKDENPEDFFALLENAFEQYQPAFDHDIALVTRAITDHWLLLRRERALLFFDAALHNRKDDYRTWLEADFCELQRFDRYKTEAARAYQRSLKNLQTIQKMARDEQRWQHQFASEKQKLAIHVERFELLKQRAAAKQSPPTAPPPAPDLPPFGAPTIPGLAQTLYIGFEDDDVTTKIFEVTPSNEELRAVLSVDDQVTRTYYFVGGVPPEYQYLVTSDAIAWGQTTCVKKIYSFDDWLALASNE